MESHADDPSSRHPRSPSFSIPLQCHRITAVSAKSSFPSAIPPSHRFIRDPRQVYEAVKRGAKHCILKPFEADKINEVILQVAGKAAVTDSLPQQTRRAASREKPAADWPLEAQLAAPNGEEENIRREPDLSGLPFEASLQDGKLVITFRRQLSESGLQHLDALIRGLRYVRHLKLVFVFETEPLMSESCWMLLTVFAARVKENIGSVAVVCPNASGHTLLGFKLYTRVYKHLDEIRW